MSVLRHTRTESVQSADPLLDPRHKTVREAIERELQGLSPEERLAVLREVEARVLPMAAPRAKGVLGTLVRLLPHRREWTIEEVRQEVAANGIEATPKEVFNALGHLARSKRIKRAGYGRFIVEGALFVTTNDEFFGLQPGPNDDD
jgi:hypothetical protein